MRFTRVLEDDQRRDVDDPKQAPWNRIAYLNIIVEDTIVEFGSGFLIKPDLLLIAGHTLDMRHGNPEVRVWLGYDAKKNSDGAYLNGWSYSRHPTLDIAVLILNKKNPDFFPLLPVQCTVGMPVRIAGYGIDYADGGVRLSYDDGKLSKVDDSIIYYNISTDPGDSGSPVFSFVDGAAIPVGVHVNPSADDFGNGAVRITPEVINDLNRMEAQARRNA